MFRSFRPYACISGGVFISSQYEQDKISTSYYAGIRTNIRGTLEHRDSNRVESVEDQDDKMPWLCALMGANRIDDSGKFCTPSFWWSKWPIVLRLSAWLKVLQNLHENMSSVQSCYGKDKGESLALTFWLQRWSWSKLQISCMQDHLLPIYGFISITHNGIRQWNHSLY
jgi:hypothetical protein